MTTNVEECGPCHVFVSECILKRKFHSKSYNKMCRHFPCLTEIEMGGGGTDGRTDN
jgi:hypothetical protein